ncbi:MAG TPA: hypothetical protein VGX25_02450 [Actinophytocola sp.]|uniref:hypothetical protein n=1 Tax=Actinophytocola sp. TaxID=1872138 RepID=UPI002DDD160E|nr:hypothetical protein [Actinophytocola sp.]HEV2778239.1 hypothetical protein [Actinophytocola sp.]
MRRPVRARSSWVGASGRQLAAAAIVALSPVNDSMLGLGAQVGPLVGLQVRRGGGQTEVSGVVGDLWGLRAAGWVVAAITAASGIVVAIRMYQTHAPARR